MKKQLTIICIILTLLAVGLSGCFEETEEKTQENANRFIGTWKVESPKFSSSTEMKWTFFENGTVKMVTYSLYNWGPSINVSVDDEQKTLTVAEVDQNYSYGDSLIAIPYYSSPYIGHISEVSSIMPWQYNDYEYAEWATYKTKDGKLYIEPKSYQSSTSSYFLYPYGAEYDFSDDDNLIILALIEYPVRLTKISDSNALRWEDVNISMSGVNEVHWDWIKLARSSISYYGNHAPSEWGDVRVGDVIQFGKYNSSMYMTLKWKPSGKSLGTWHFTRSPETLYVGGTGAQNFTTIQDAIDNASEGDTVFVYNGTYYENIIVDKSLILFGENRNNTVIDGNESGDVICLYADGITVSFFTIKNSLKSVLIGDHRENWRSAGIYINSKYNLVSDNNIISNNHGILIEHSNNTICRNTVKNNQHYGIFISGYSNNNILFDNEITGNSETAIYITWYSSNNSVYENIISNISISSSSFNNIHNNSILSTKDSGVYLSGSSYNIINENLITSINRSGVLIHGSSNNNTVTRNTIQECGDYGINIFNSNDNYIYYNNLINNTLQFLNNIKQNAFDDSYNIWDDGMSKGNYWDSYEGTDDNDDGIGDISYNIFGGDNQDFYPLMEPFDI